MTQLYSQDLRRLPKIDLHRHLDCSMRWSTMLEIARTLNLPLPPSPSELREHFLISEPMKDLESVLHKFLTAQKLLASTEILERLAFEACEDAFNDGVQVLELRYAPTFICEGHDLTFDDVHQAFLRGLQRAERIYPMATGLICIVQRILSKEKAAEVSQFAIENKASFLALDLADNEEGFDPLPFAPYFMAAKKAGLNITIHSGEAPNPDAGRWVRDSIEALGADRIGHGVQIIHFPEVMELVRKNSICLEVCPVSNYLTQAFPSYQMHPIKKLREQGVPVTVNSDDPGIFATTLSDDYEVLHRVHGFGAKDFAEMNEQAFHASFIATDKKARVWKRTVGINKK